MKIKCEYCGSFISDTDEKCEFCGATNSHLIRKGTGIPETIEQLIEFAKQHNLPLEKMHYHLGENYTGPQAIGIYLNEETGNYIVYKNKTDGTRAVRYEGKDEAYAVNEIYQKMKSDMNHQRTKGPAPQNNAPNNKSGALVKVILAIMVVIVVLVVVSKSARTCSSPSTSTGTGSGYVTDYGSISSDDTDSSWWSSDNDDSGSSWWNSNDDDNSSSWWNSDNSSWNNDNWNSSDWNWNSSDSWNSGGSDWNSNW